MSQRSAHLAIVLLSLLLITATFSAAARASGFGGVIPQPVWEKLNPLKAEAPEWPDRWPGEEVPGYYYVDKSSPLADDRSNPFGYPDRPRSSIPEIAFPAGAYVEVRGGPYDGGGQIIIMANGTADQPVWLRGATTDEKALIRGELILKGSYVFLENLHFDSNRSLGLRPHQNSSLHHVMVRNCHFDGPGSNAGHHSAIAVSGRPGPHRYNDIIIFGNRIHGFGDRDSATENDFHGIAVGTNVDRVWILENAIFEMSGDSVQVGTTSAPVDRQARHIYIGHNRFHDNRENAVDIKSAANVVVYRNKMHGFEVSSTSTGAAVVIHNNPKEVWIIGNTISRSNHGVLNTGGQNVWVMSNVFFDINHHGAWNPRRLYSSGSAIHFRGDSSGGIVNNTFHNYDVGVQLARGIRGYSVVNNIFSHRTRPDGYDIIASDRHVVANTFLSNLVFLQPSGERIYWRDRVLSASQIARSGACQRCVITDGPLFVDADGGDFYPRPGSPVIDTGAATDKIREFATADVPEAATDSLGRARVQGEAVDIGAVESRP